VAVGKEDEGWELLFNGCRDLDLQEEKTNDGEGCTTMWMYSTPLNCILKKGKFYVMYILWFFWVLKNA
jgi:hypothetical protein